MASLDKEKKSNRLLGSRRYTHDVLNDAQEAFTEVLDIGASEVYTHANLIPEQNLPFSGSTQLGQVYSSGGNSVLKYWYRHKLTKSNLNNEAWFFLDPVGSDSGIGAQLIDPNQKTNFISPKYSLPSLANSTTEDATPGYLAVVYKSTTTNTASLGNSDIVSTNDYVFDYKTGVLQFNSSGVDPSNSEYVYMTVYQYVGQTLQSGLEVTGDIKAGGHIKAEGYVIAKRYVVSSSVTHVTTSFSSGSTMFGDTQDDTHQMTGSMSITGSLDVFGLTTLHQTAVGDKALIVKGFQQILDQAIGAATQKAKLEIQGLGDLGNTTDEDDLNILDLGDGFQ